MAANTFTSGKQPEHPEHSEHLEPAGKIEKAGNAEKLRNAENVKNAGIPETIGKKMMTPRERFLRVLKHQPADRVPLDIQGFNNHWSPTVEGWSDFPSTEELSQQDSPKILELYDRLKDKNTIQHCVPTWINRYLVTPPQRIEEVVTGEDSDARYFKRLIDTPKGPLTAQLKRSRDSYGMVWTLKYPVETLDDVKKIRSIPFELPEKLSPVDLKTLPEDPWGQRLTYAYATTPAICAAGMMGMENFLLHCALEPELIRELVDEALERILRILEFVLSNRSVDIVWIGGSEWLTPPMASPQMYDELIWQSEKKIADFAHKHGALVHLHCHGNIRSVLPKMIAAGADYTEPAEPPPDGDVTFAEAKRMAEGKIVLGGNIELHNIENSSREEVEKLVCSAFEGSAFEGRKSDMILATSAGSNRISFPENMIENYHTMIDVWEKMSLLDQ